MLRIIPSIPSTGAESKSIRLDSLALCKTQGQSAPETRSCDGARGYQTTPVD